MTMSLEKLWRELEANGESEKEGWIRRLANPGCRVAVYAALASQRPKRSMMLDIPLGVLGHLRELPTTIGLSVQLAPPLEGVSPEIRSVVIELDDSQFSDIFSVFCEDLLLRVSDCQRASDAISLLLKRVERWQEFLSQAKEGLSRNEVVGLYGELALLREILLPLGGLAMIQAWTGAEHTPQDFNIPGICGIEVKTSTERVLSHVQINGERQLDDSGFVCLFLICQRVEASEKHGESLNDVVKTLRLSMTEKPEFLDHFDSRLGKARYFDRDQSRYEQQRFRLAQRRIFRVDCHFPRVLISDLKPGVSEVTYRLDLNSCVKNECDPKDLTTVLESLNFSEFLQ